MLKERFLLIKSWGYSLWADVEHVMGQLLVAQLTGRIPVVHWGMDSVYSESMNTNAYELFFEPISPFTIDDVIHPDFTYHPSIWDFTNVMMHDPDKLRWKDRDIQSMMTSDANVVVSDVYYHINAIIPWVKEDHPLYGKTVHQIYRYLYDYYLEVKPEIKNMVQDFINRNTNFRDEKPIVGVHVRGNALVNEANQLYSMNNFYHPNIWQFFTRYSARHVLLITDSKKIEKEYMKLYYFNDVIIVSDSKKKPFKGPIRPCNSDYPNKRHKSIELIKDAMEVLKDTYLALECDFFIGNGYSSMSNAVLRLKDWPEANIKILY